MKILVIGAGAQGGPCTSILARDPDIGQIILGDIDTDLAQKVKAKVNSSKVSVQKVNAGDVDDIVQAAKGMDVIITLTLTAFNDNVMQAALKTGAHYVDTSFGEPSLMDICARENMLGQIIQQKPIGFDREFKAAGLTAIAGCGASPGVINVMARYLADKLDAVDAIRIRVGRRSTTPSQEVISAWQPTWSPFRALWGYAVEPTIFEDGRYKKYPIYSGYEDYRYPDPVGVIPLVYHQHQEPITLPHFIGKGIKYCDFKYTIDKNAGTLIKNGFASSDPVNVKGVQVAPIDVLLAMVPKPGDTFLAETAESAGQPLTVAGRAAVEVSGRCGEEKVEYKVVYPISMYADGAERRALFDRFGASNIYVSLPAVAGAKMCLRNEAPRGVIAAECLDPVQFLKTMREMGAGVQFQEFCTRHPVI